MLSFSKFHGLGNDFIIIEYADVKDADHSRLALEMCDRHTGIGADGLIISRDNEMIIYNSDGSRAPMCGNGIRTYVHYEHMKNPDIGSFLSVDTLAGEMKAYIISTDPFVVKINMGKPVFSANELDIDTDKESFINETVLAGGKLMNLSTIDMGTLHTVTFVDDLCYVDVDSEGALVESDKLFPKKTNVNFVEVLDRDNIRVETFERGAGHTLACGTGACASVVLSNRLKGTARKVNVHLPLGSLLIEITDEGSVYMQGPSEYVFRGEYAGY